jgi:hypothetical protein
MAAAPFTPEMIAGVVREVLRRIRAEAPATGGSIVSATPSPPASPAPPAAAAAPASGGSLLAEKVVTAALLARLPVDIRSVLVRADAVLTPSARDQAREMGIEVVRSQAEQTSPRPGQVPASPRPFVVAYADCQGDVGARCAGIVRAVRGAQQLPASGLADVVGALASHALGDGARGVLLTSRPHAATALANRSKSLRAVTARDPATLLAAASECAANLLVINPRELSAFHCERLARELSRANWGDPPPELSAAPAPCACSSHPH